MTGPKSRVVLLDGDAAAARELAAALPARFELVPGRAGTPRDAERRYREVVDSVRAPIFVAGLDGTLEEVNPAGVEFFGYGPDEAAGRSIDEWWADAKDGDRLLGEVGGRGFAHDFEAELVTRDGQRRWCLIHATPRLGPDGTRTGIQGLIHDITSRKRVEAQLQHDAFHDALTGLANRALFLDRVDRAIARRSRRPQFLFAVLFLDLDGFKVVNDSLGHLHGDRLLELVAERLLGCVREVDTVARMGGDEFAVLLDGLDTPADATHAAERVLRELKQPFDVAGHEVVVTASVGVTIAGPDSESPTRVLRDADLAMYRAKALGRDRYQVFDPAMHEAAVRLLQLESDLRLAVERQEFVLHYQPVFQPAERRLVGFEALLRWHHPTRGLIGPTEFVAVAEETGLIVPVGAWAVREACARLAEWQELSGDRTLGMAVNLSARQFAQPGLIELIEEALRDSGIEPATLSLEITEAGVMQHPEQTLVLLERLQRIGVRICMDDFGTGYSAVSYLHRFPVDALKIDRTFVTALGGSGGNVDLVRTLVALARSLGMEPVAEGVETEGQLSELTRLGSSLVQGFLLSRPLDADAARSLVAGETAVGPDAEPTAPPDADTGTNGEPNGTAELSAEG